MADAKEELIVSFMAKCKECLNDVQAENISNILFICLNGYSVTKECNALSTNTVNPNEWYMKQFLAIKMIKGLSEKTLQFYKLTMLDLFKYVTKSVVDIEINDIRYYLALKIQNGVSKTTANNYLRNIKSFFGTLNSEGYIPRDPTRRIDCIKEEQKVKKAFSEMEIEMLRKEFSSKVREKALLETLLSTGCRVSELVSIDIDDMKDNVITVTGKGNKQRPVYLNSAAKFAIQEYLKTRSDENQALFVSQDKPHERLKKSRIEVIFRETGRKLGIENCHPHRFRRTMATKALVGGMPIEQVSRILGHNQLTTTQIYARSDDFDIQQAHKKYVK